MFQFEPADSPFYKAHEEICQRIIDEIQSNGGDVSGFCNSYGYTITSTLEDKSGKIELEINKFQTPRNGVIVPMDASETVRTSLSLHGVDTNMQCNAGQSIVKRLFSATVYKRLLASPAYFNGNISPQTILWLVNIGRFKLNVYDGVIYYQQYIVPERIMGLVDALRSLKVNG